VKLQLGQRTEAKVLPQWGQFFALRGTSAPQLSQKKRGFLEPFFLPAAGIFRPLQSFGVLSLA
jgi:hypothetical protein